MKFATKRLSRWSTALRDQVRCLARPALRGLPYFDFSCAELYALAGLRGPVDALHANRLRYFRRLVLCGTSLIWKLLCATTAPESWLHALRDSFRWLRTFSVHPHLPASDDIDDWLLFVQVSDRWKGLIKAALSSCRVYRQEHARSKVNTLDIQRKLRCLGVDLPLCSSAGTAKPVQQQIRCGACDKVFAHKRALAMHCVHAHGYRRWPKYYILGPQCLACGSMYTTRARALLHLSSSSRCAARYRACFPPIPETLALELDEVDRETARSLKSEGWHATKALQPVFRCPYVPLPLPGQDARRMWLAWSQRNGDIGTGFANLFGMVEEVDPVEVQVNDIPPFVLNSVTGSQAGHVGVFMMDGISLATTRVFLKYKVFVHFFSGYRRRQDLQWSIENEFPTTDGVVFCLSIDLCLQKARSDLSDDKNLAWWQARMASGQVVGVGGGAQL